MKPKSLLLCVGLCFAAALQPRAQPFSYYGPANWFTNVVEIPPGLSTIANPVNHYRGRYAGEAVLDNSVAAVLPQVPVGTVLYKFDASSKSWSPNFYWRFRWSRPAETLAPGDGAMIFNPTRRVFRATFTGNPVYGLGLDLPVGWSFASYPGVIFDPLPPPPPGVPDGYWAFDRRLIPQEGDMVWTFDHSRRHFVPHTFHNSTWDVRPVVSPFESFYLNLTSPRSIRDYNIGPLRPR